jgi:hypothetical protein
MDNETRFLIVMGIIIAVCAGALIHQFVTDFTKPRPYGRKR